MKISATSIRRGDIILVPGNLRKFRVFLVRPRQPESTEVMMVGLYISHTHPIEMDRGRMVEIRLPVDSHITRYCSTKAPQHCMIVESPSARARLQHALMGLSCGDDGMSLEEIAYYDFLICILSLMLDDGPWFSISHQSSLVDVVINYIQSPGDRKELGD